MTWTIRATAMAMPPSVAGFADETRARNDGMVLAGFIVSLAGLVIFGVVLGLVGFILAAVGYKRVMASGGMLLGKGFATAGMIIGVIDVAVEIFILRLLFF